MGELKPFRYGVNLTTFKGGVGREMVRNAGNPTGAHGGATATAEAYRAFAADVVKRATAALEVAAEGSYSSDRLRLILAEPLALYTEIR